MTYSYTDRTPPIATRWLRRVGRSLTLLLTAVMLLSLGTPQAHAQPSVTLLQSWARPYNPDTYRDAVAPFPFFQIIHHAGVGEVDVYVDDRKLLDDFAFHTATPFVTVWWGSHTIDVVAGADADNSHPIWTDTLWFRPNVNYALIAMGTPADSTLDVLVLEDLPLEARNPDRVEYALVHTAPNAPALDVRTLDAVHGNRPSDLVANNLAFGGFRGPAALAPAGHNFQVTNADNSVIFDVLRFELQRAGETFIFLITPGASDSTVTLVGIDVFGNVLSPAITTATEDAATVPKTLALRGNYPNPFNPATTIAFDLPETARVRVELIDLLGRTVMTIPARQVEAGAGHTLSVDASSLASGTYLYRVIAQTPTRTLTQTGRMVLIR